MGSTILQFNATTLGDIDTLISRMQGMKRLHTLDVSMKTLSQTKAEYLGAPLNRQWNHLNIGVEQCDEGTGEAFLRVLAKLPTCQDFSVSLQGFEVINHAELQQNVEKCVAAFKDHLEWSKADFSGRASMALQYLEEDVKEISDAVSSTVGYGYNQALTYMQGMNPSQYMPSMPQVNPFATCMAPCMNAFESEQAREERVTGKKFK